MSEPTAWQWVEAWRNGTISDEEFNSLQKLLREEPDARRTLRAYMAMDTALRDRAEARLLGDASEVVDGLSRHHSTAAERSPLVWREVVAWSTATVCLLLAMAMWFTRPATTPNPQMVVGSDPRTGVAGVKNRETAAVELTIAEQREQLLASAPDVLHLKLASDSGGEANKSDGDIVWSSGRQMGYLRLRGMASSDSMQRQYQLWIVGSDVSGNEIINAGVFPVDRNTGELILPIQANQYVPQPKMFVVSVEAFGVGTALTVPLLASADGLEL